MSAAPIIHVLELMIEVHDSLTELAESKKHALIDNKVDQLMAIVNKESKLMKQLTGLLQEQQDTVRRFFQAKGLQLTRQITVTELIKLIPEPSEKQALVHKQTLLNEKIQILKAHNELNQQLIEQSLAFINYSYDLLMGPEEDVIYQHPNQQHAANKRNGYFDTKA